MPLVTVELAAHMDDGRVLAVVADQRDFARWEIQPEADSAGTNHTRARFLAWSAAQRQGLYKGSFIEFNTVDCVQVDSGDDGGGDGEATALDPGRPEATDAR